MLRGVSLQHVQIGEVAERTGLSLRTIRYYEEMGLVRPSARSTGGFRLYTEADVARLLLIKRMKPLDFSVEDIRDLLGLLDLFEIGPPEPSKREFLLDRLAMYSAVADARVLALQEHLAAADRFAGDLRQEINRQRRVLEPGR
jgi:DNA-binding transcriptional MerR regulator